MTDFPTPILDYWSAIFESGTVITCSEALSITVSPFLNWERQAMILEQAGSHARAALTPALAEKISVDRMQGASAAELRRRLADRGVTLHDPDLIFYVPTASSRALAGESLSVFRQLTGADREAFDALQASASEPDLEDAYVELDHWAVFGSFNGDRLVSVASAYPWDNAPIADLGVLTLPGFRGRGHARAVVKAISRFARARGLEPQYRCQVDNSASVALAASSGFAPFGRWEVIAAGMT